MTDNPSTSIADSMGNRPQKRIKFYRNKRIVRSVWVSLVILITTGNFFLFIMSHILSTLFWDWWFFTHKGFKDSHEASEAYFVAAEVTPEQMDAFNVFMVKLRRVFFPLSLVTAGLCWTFYPSFGFDLAFWLSYTLGVFSSAVIAEKLGKIKFPYPFEGKQEKWNNLPYPMSVINSPFFDPSSDNLAVNPFGRPHKFKSPTCDNFFQNFNQTKTPFD